MSVVGVALTQGYALDAFTFTGNVTNDQTVTIGDIVYKFEADPAAAYDVDVGTDLTTSMVNLAAAINRGGTPGTEYFDTGTLANPYVSAVANADDDGVDLYARVNGDQVNGVYLAISAAASGGAIANSGATFGAAAGTVTLGSGLLVSWIAGAQACDAKAKYLTLYQELA